MNPNSNSSVQTWPLLVVFPGRVHVFFDDQVLSCTAPLSVPGTRESALESLDVCGQGADVDLREIRWRPAGVDETDFWRRCYELALRAGGLRYYGVSNLPLEGLESGVGDWSADFPIVRVGPAPEPAPLAARSAGTILVYANPAGEPSLREIRREAEAVLAELPGRSVRFLARTVSAAEWHELLAAGPHDAVFYFGHGRAVSGQPAIPVRDGWTALLPAGLSGLPPLFVFAACLGGAGDFFWPRAGAVVHPACRLADRPAVFVRELARALHAGQSLPRAYHAACQADRAAGDVRRFVFRLQGTAPAWDPARPSP